MAMNFTAARKREDVRPRPELRIEDHMNITHTTEDETDGSLREIKRAQPSVKPAKALRPIPPFRTIRHWGLVFWAFCCPLKD